MSNVLAADIGYGGYISLFKIATYIVMFFAWMPLVNWIHSDSQSVRTNVMFWTKIISAVGAAGMIVWILAPMYFIGLAVYIITVGATVLVYVMHRNAMVADFEKVLTPTHIKSLFVNEEKKMAKKSKGISLITANKNEVPLPSAKSPEGIGFGLVCEIFEDAMWRRAEEVMFQPSGEEYNVIYRIDGMASKQQPRTREEMEYLIRFIKQLGDMNIEERRKPQKSNFTVQKDDNSAKWEITTAGSTAGEQLWAKRLEAFNIMKIDELGFEEKQLEHINTIRGNKTGLFLVSGPKKSGVTSTLYAIIKTHDPFLNDIHLLEKRPSGELQNITQHMFNMSDTGTTTYDMKLRSISRMGANIMGVGDCEDSRTAQECMNALNDDKLMHVSLEASSVVTALGKWLKFVPNKHEVIDNLIGICNQRLVRRLCEECKQAYQPNPQLLKRFSIQPEKAKILYREAEPEYDRHGRPILCENCQGTGFYGRIGIYEVIMLNDELKASVKEAKSLQEIASLFRRSGMLYMQEQAMKKVTDGIISINEVIREFSSVPKKKTAKKTEK